MQIQVIAASNEIAKQLINLCDELNSSQFSKPLEVLSGNSIGKHVRHIVEFYDLLIEAYEKDIHVCYDRRTHCENTEKDVDMAKSRIVNIKNWISNTKIDTKLKLEISYDNQSAQNFSVDTSLERELVYNIEHAIHHMAIIRIAVEKAFDFLNLDPNFGIAYSTIRYRDDLCAH